MLLIAHSLDAPQSTISPPLLFALFIGCNQQVPPLLPNWWSGMHPALTRIKPCSLAAWMGLPFDEPFFRLGWRMKWILLFAYLFTLNASADSFIIGQPFEKSPWSKPSKFVKVEKKNIKDSDDVIYIITHSNFPDYQTIVSVSAKTHLIYKFTSSGNFESIYEAVYFAASICGGEVFMPDRAVAHQGFPLKNIPGGDNEGKVFTISISVVPRSQYFDLSVDCQDYRR